MISARSHEAFVHTLRSRGALDAVAYLNEGVPHRYTAVYQLEDGVLRNLILHDKLGEVRPEFLAEVKLEESFCQFVLRDGFFTTDDSSADTRLDGHPYQGVMVCYHGVPVLGNNGELAGTLCHFDVQTFSLPDTEYELMQRAARMLPGFVDIG